MIHHSSLPYPISYTLRFSGERDASSLHLIMAGRVPTSSLSGVKTFQYSGVDLFQWSPGSGYYTNDKGDFTTNITYNIGIQLQNRSDLIHKGYQLFSLWEEQIPELVKGIFATDNEVAGELVPGTTFGTWAGILGENKPDTLIKYLEEPIEGRIKSIDEVMKYLREDWQTMLIVDPVTDTLRLVCLLDAPSIGPS